MIIIWRVKEHELGAFTLQELGLSDSSEYNGEMYEYSQRILHLFFVPTLSVGTKWKLYRDNDYHPIDDERLEQLESLGLKGKWYANLGFIIVFLLVLLYWLAAQGYIG